MRVTQQDIAKFANVSQATVSRVLAGDERVDADIRDRVLGTMKEHNYQPDVRARSLRQRKTHLIGLVLKREVGSLQGDPFFAMLVAEIVDCLAGTPWHLCVDIATDDIRQKHVYDDLLRTRRVDGLILVESEPSDTRILSLQEDDFPFVVIGNASDTPELYAIDNDNVFAGELAAKHLKDQGYSRIGFVGGPENLTVTRDRIKGYKKQVENPIIEYAGFGLDEAKSAALRMLRSPQRPDAIIALDDFMAMGVIQAVREMDLCLGRDIGVIGFNDSPTCRMIEGGLTSINMQIETLVGWAIRRLLQVIEKQSVTGRRQSTVGCELIMRGSTIRRTRVAVL